MGASSSLKLNNGLDCPMIGLDVSQIIIEDLQQISVEDIIYQSILEGVRLIDTEPSYEITVGNQIKRAIDENRVKRSDLFIVAKMELKDKDDPLKAISQSLENLQLNYVDLYLDHWPSCINYKDPNSTGLIPIYRTWEKMENLVTLGKTKAIGVCNYNIENLLNIISRCRIKPAVNEVEFNPYLYQSDLKQFCDLENIKIFAYNPLAKGVYYQKRINLLNKYEGYLEAPLNYLANSYRITRNQLTINWHFGLGIVPILGANITKPITNDEIQSEKARKEIQEIFKVNKIDLDKKYIELLNSFTENQYRLNDGSDIFGINIFA